MSTSEQRSVLFAEEMKKSVFTLECDLDYDQIVRAWAPTFDANELTLDWRFF